MNRIKKCRNIVLSIIIVSVFTLSEAASYKQLVIFGDSYSDNGNTFRASGSTYPGIGYSLGRFSDGPTWSEYLAQGLGFNVMDPLVFKNYAFGQAQISGVVNLSTHDDLHTWNFTVPDLAGEIDEYLHDPNLKPKETLFAIFIGANDLMNFIPSTDENALLYTNKMISSLNNSLDKLLSLGAKKIIIFNLRALEKTPLAKQLGDQYTKKGFVKNPGSYLELINNMIMKYNIQLSKLYKNNSHIYLYDVNLFDHAVLNKKQKSYRWIRQKYTFTEGANACYINHGNYVDFSGELCRNSWNFFFYDRIHPSTYAHYLMANDLAKKLK